MHMLSPATLDDVESSCYVEVIRGTKLLQFTTKSVFSEC